MTMTRPAFERGSTRSVAAAVVVGAILLGAAAQVVRIVGAERPSLINFWQDDGVVAVLDRLTAADTDASGAATPPAPLGAAEVAARAAELNALLRRSPLERRVLYALIDLYRKTGDETRAGQIERVAVDMSLRDGDIQLAYVSRIIGRGDPKEILRRVDGLIRAFPQASLALQALLASLALSPEIRDETVAVLKSQPPWRRSYLRLLRDTIADRSVYTDVYRALTEPEPLLARVEIGDHIAALIGWGMVEDARRAWIEVNRRRDVAVPYGVFDGSFTREPDNMPFGWQIMPARGVVATFAPAREGDGRRILQLQFLGDRRQTFGIQQVLALEPGPHVLTGQAQTAGLQNSLGLVVRLICRSRENAYSPLATTNPERGTSRWHEFRVEFVVPETGCETQILRPETKGVAVLDTEVSGSIDYSDLAITRR